MTVYDEAYLNEYKRRAETDLGKKIMQARWSLVQKYILNGGRILDWGCGVGNFITSNPDSYYVAGYDVNPHAGFPNYELFHDWWDGVTLWDVLEHVYRPDLFLRLLKSEFVFIVTPNASYIDNLKEWKHYKPNEHQHYFTESSLGWIMRRAGFKPLHVDFEEGKLRDPEHETGIITIVGRRK
jgi:hypothetical protein